MTDKEEIRKIEDMLEKYFPNKDPNYFHSSDAYRNIAGDSYIRYKFLDGNKGKVVITLGGTEIEEMPIKVCSTAEQIENLVKAILY